MKEINKEELGKIIAVVLFGGLFIYIYISYFWNPYSKKINDDKIKLEKINNDIENAKKIKAQFKNLEEKLKQLEADKIEAEKKLPKEKKIPDLIKTLKYLSDKYSISILSIDVSGSVKEQYFTKVKYNISVKGKYNNIGNFFASIALEKRILNIEDLSLSQITEGDNTCRANFVLSVYQYGG